MKFYSIIIFLILAVMIVGVDKTTEAAEKGKTPSIAKAKGGYTVEELFAKKDMLKGKKVAVHGKVVKISEGIMGRTWIHLQDGSGKQGTNDITVTTNQSARVGDIVLITGYLVTDKDFGAGYKYAVIIEDAAIKTDK